MTGATLALITIVCLSASTVLAMIVGAAASIMGDRPGEDAITTSGHRALAWGCALTLAGVAALLAIETWGPQWLG